MDILQWLFGDKVLEYVIVVFTGGDELEEEEITLEKHCAQAPDASSISWTGAGTGQSCSTTKPGTSPPRIDRLPIFADRGGHGAQEWRTCLHQ